MLVRFIQFYTFKYYMLLVPPGDLNLCNDTFCSLTTLNLLQLPEKYQAWNDRKTRLEQQPAKLIEGLLFFWEL